MVHQHPQFNLKLRRLPEQFLESVDLAYNRLYKAIRTARMCRVRKGSGMAKLVFGMNQSLDGYVDHMAFAPSPTLLRYFIEEAQGQAGSVYGRQISEVTLLGQRAS